MFSGSDRTSLLTVTAVLSDPENMSLHRQNGPADGALCLAPVLRCSSRRGCQKELYVRRPSSMHKTRPADTWTAQHGALANNGHICPIYSERDPPASRAARQRAAPAGRPQPRQLARGMEEAIEPSLGLLASRRTQSLSRKSRALKRAGNKHVNRRSARVPEAAAEK